MYTLGKSYNGNKIHIRIGQDAALCNSRGGISMQGVSVSSALMVDESHYCAKCIGTKAHLQKLYNENLLLDK